MRKNVTFILWILTVVGVFYFTTLDNVRCCDDEDVNITTTCAHDYSWVEDSEGTTRQHKCSICGDVDAKQYYVTVINGSGSGWYDEGTKVTIRANDDHSEISDEWYGKTSTVEGNVRYHYMTTYTFYAWSNTWTYCHEEREMSFKVYCPATFIAYFYVEDIKVDKQICINPIKTPNSVEWTWYSYFGRKLNNTANGFLNNKESATAGNSGNWKVVYDKGHLKASKKAWTNNKTHSYSYMIFATCPLCGWCEGTGTGSHRPNETKKDTIDLPVAHKCSAYACWVDLKE